MKKSSDTMLWINCNVLYCALLTVLLESKIPLYKIYKQWAKEMRKNMCTQLNQLNTLLCASIYTSSLPIIHWSDNRLVPRGGGGGGGGTQVQRGRIRLLSKSINTPKALISGPKSTLNFNKTLTFSSEYYTPLSFIKTLTLDYREHVFQLYML